jgi:tRNA pseudouridine-54 N-methylase
MSADQAETSYTLHLRDSSGHVLRLEITCASDAEALGAAREQRVRHVVEVWQGGRKVGTVD